MSTLDKTYTARMSSNRITESLPSLPPSIKAISPFVQRANELRTADPIMAYWCTYYAAQMGLGLRSQEQGVNKYLSALITYLEEMKHELGANDAIDDQAAAAAYIENFALKVFSAADSEDRMGNATRATAKKFLAATHFLELLRIFEETDNAAQAHIEKIRYAKWKASDIAKAIREGRRPMPGSIQDNLAQEQLQGGDFIERLDAGASNISHELVSEVDAIRSVPLSTGPIDTNTIDDSSNAFPNLGLQGTNGPGDGGQLVQPAASEPPVINTSLPEPATSALHDTASVMAPDPQFPTSIDATNDKGPDEREIALAAAATDPGHRLSSLHSFSVDTSLFPFAQVPPTVASHIPVCTHTHLAAQENVAAPSPSTPKQRLCQSSSDRIPFGVSPPPPRLSELSDITVELTPSIVAKAQKHCRFAISALEYEDAEQAQKELRAALALLEYRMDKSVVDELSKK